MSNSKFNILSLKSYTNDFNLVFAIRIEGDGLESFFYRNMNLLLPNIGSQVLKMVNSECVRFMIKESMNSAVNRLSDKSMDRWIMCDPSNKAKSFYKCSSSNQLNKCPSRN